MAIDPGAPADSAASGNGRMTPLRVITIGLCIAIIMLDGFDVFAAAYTVPRIAREWELTPDRAGILLSCGLMGMAVGTLLLSSLADMFGRRRIVLFWVAIVGAAMFASAAAHDFWTLAALRLFAGLGIGALSSTLAVLAAETAPDRHRDLVLGLLTGGFPAGAILGGLVAGPLLESHGWRAVYVLGGGCAALLLPVALLWLPESIDTLRRRGTPKALEQARRQLTRMGMAAKELTPAGPESKSMWQSLAVMLAPPARNSILLLVGCYTICVAPVYFINSWAPKLATGFGLSDGAAISVSVTQSLGSVLGGLLTGLLTARLGRRKLALIALGSFVVLLCTYPVVGANLGVNGLRIHGVLFGLAMFCSGIGMFAMILEAFPSSARATGVGLAIGVARIGSSAGPYVGGLLLSSGLAPLPVCAIMALPVVLSATILYKRSGNFGIAAGK